MRTKHNLVDTEDVDFLTPTRPSECRNIRPANPNNRLSLGLLLSPRRRNLKKYTSTCDIWCLPSSLLEYISSFLHISDLLNLIQVNSKLNDLLNHSTVAWRTVKFTDIWPSKDNLKFFKRASDLQNFEATVKLGVAHLYNEGLPHDDKPTSVHSNALSAARLLGYADKLSKSQSPFSWLLYRPPWSLKNCCKELVYQRLKCDCAEKKESISGEVLTCIAKIALLNNDYNLAMDCLEDAKSQHQCVNAAYMLWQLRQSKSQNNNSLENETESVRQLRSVVSMGPHLDATLSLLDMYMSERYGGLDSHIAADYTQTILQKSQSLNLRKIFSTQSTVTASMRYILVDWLIEVSTVKGFSSQTLHQSIYLMDNYMYVNKSIPRSQLQLLGVASLVVCSRYMSSEVITIWEACWLTDNTYQYQDVVKMIADIITSLRGNIRVPTVLDYIRVLSKLADCSDKERHLSEYICELCLQHVDLTVYKQSYLAASCIILSKVMLKEDDLWGERCVQFTGFMLQDLRPCLLHIHEKCFVEEAPKDHRDVKLDSVRLRYSSEVFDKVSDIAVIGRDALLFALGGEKSADEWVQAGVNLRLRSQPYLIKSPSRKTGSCEMDDDVVGMAESAKRDDAGTPPPCRRACIDNSLLSVQDGDGAEFGDDSCLDSELDESMDDTYESLLTDYLLSPSMLAHKDNRKQSISIDLLSPIGAISNHNTGLSKPTAIKSTPVNQASVSNSTTSLVGVSSKSPNYAIGGASGSNATPWNEPALSQQTKRKFNAGYSSTSRRPKYQ